MEDIIELVSKLIDRVPNAIISSVDGEGYPNIKAMLPPRMRDGMKHIFFSTNTSSLRAQQYMQNPKACLYFYDNEKFKGVMLKGSMEVLYDNKLREMLWHEGDEMYYSKGVQDPDYCILRFTIKSGRYYSSFKSTDFTID